MKYFSEKKQRQECVYDTLSVKIKKHINTCICTEYSGRLCKELVAVAVSREGNRASREVR